MGISEIADIDLVVGGASGQDEYAQREAGAAESAVSTVHGRIVNSIMTCR
jgi:hypothetical protein